MVEIEIGSNVVVFREFYFLTVIYLSVYMTYQKVSPVNLHYTWRQMRDFPFLVSSTHWDVFTVNYSSFLVFMHCFLIKYIQDTKWGKTLHAVPNMFFAEEQKPLIFFSQSANIFSIVKHASSWTIIFHIKFLCRNTTKFKIIVWRDMRFSYFPH